MTRYICLALFCCGLVHIPLSGWSEETTFPYVLEWKRLTHTPLLGSLAWGDSLIFVGGVDGTVLALSQHSGLRTWQRRGHGPVRHAPLVLDDILVFADA